MPVKIKRSEYASMFGPTVGDKIRLADTDLIIEVEKDLTIYGEGQPHRSTGHSAGCGV